MKKSLVLMLSVMSLQAGWMENMKEKAHNIKESTVSTYANVKEKTISEYKNYAEKRRQAHEKDIETCVDNLKINLSLYATVVEQYYLDVNKRNESKIINAYADLKEKGISAELLDILDPETASKLQASSSSLEYMNIVMSSLKQIYSKVKDEDSENLKKLVDQTRFMLFSWTAIYEILSTKKIYKDSLLGLNPKLYSSFDKELYDRYSIFIYSLFYKNMIQDNIFARRDNLFTDITDASYSSKKNFKEKDIAALRKICEENVDTSKDLDKYIVENLSSGLNLDKKKLIDAMTKISKNNNTYEAPAFFDKDILRGMRIVPIIENPLNDNWYMMIREYMELQESFYKIKKAVNNILKVISGYPDSYILVAKLKRDLMRVDSLYRKFDEIVRYNIIDLPVSIYADLYKIKFLESKRWFDDDKKKLADIAVAYNKACANMQKYMVSDFAIKKVISVTSIMKREFEDEKEWKQIQTRAKLTQDWFNMLNKVTITNK